MPSPARRLVAATLVAAALSISWNLPAGAAPAHGNGAPAGPPVSASIRAIQSYGQLPLSFEPNRGQVDASVAYVARGPQYRLLLMPGSATVMLNRPATADAAPIRIDFVGSSDTGQLEGIEALPGIANYFIGNDRTRWLTAIPTYARVAQPGLYRNIDVVYYGNPSRLEYDFIVHPGADPDAIRMQFSGAERMRIDGAGDLHLAIGPDEITLEKPIVYQMVGGERQPVHGEYALLGGLSAGFRIGSYDARLPLVIDPVLTYSTYLGGGGNENAYAVAVDALGSAYVAGATNSLNFPVTTGPGFASNNGLGNPDGFVAKLNPAGNAVVYATYLGGSCTDIVFGVAVNATGEAHLTGTTGSGVSPAIGGPDCGPLSSPDPHFHAFPQVAPLQAGYGGLSDAFVAKLNSAGSALLFSSFLGGNHTDFGKSIALDPAGNAYVAGETISTNFPVTPGAFQPINHGGMDAFVTKIGAAHGLVWSTYVGGSDLDRARGIAVDAGGHAYVTGMTASGSVTACNLQSTPGPFFPTTVGALQPQIAPSPPINAIGCNALPGGQPVTPNLFDAFVLKLNPAGTGPVYSTYLGGGTGGITGTHGNDRVSAFDEGHAIAVDASGHAYVTGATGSSDFPTKNPYQGTYQGGSQPPGDAFITKLDPAGSQMVWSTYLGGSGYDEGNGIVVNAAGETLVIGTTAGGLPAIDSIPGPGGPPPTTFGGAFLLKFNAGGSAPIFLTGMIGTTTGAGIALDPSGNAYVTGDTGGSLQTVNAAQPAYAGFNDAYVAKIGSAAVQTTTVIVSDNPDPSAAGQAVNIVFTVTATSGTPVGTVMVTANTLESCSAPVTAGSCSLSFTSTGARTLTAAYQGGSGFAPSASGPASHLVVRANSATSILSDAPDPSLPGQPVTIAFKVTGSGATPIGSVTVSSSTGEVCSGPLAAGNGSCTITFNSTGTRTLLAVYTGDGFFNGSISPGQSHAVIRAAVATSLTSSLNPSLFGQPVTFTASVNPTISGLGTPTGSVTFLDGATLLATVPLGPTAQAVYPSSALGVGTHPISASYSGDLRFEPGAAAVLNQQVHAPPLANSAFVIGDGDASVGAQVTFWGAQWSRLNRLSGGSAPASFKGHVTTAGVPTCAGGPNWQSAPGNSSNPPASVGGHITVLVASAISKKGSVISGNRPQLAVVRTHPGYGASPGHAGTGTVVSLICP